MTEISQSGRLSSPSEKHWEKQIENEKVGQAQFCHSYPKKEEKTLSRDVWVTDKNMILKRDRVYKTTEKKRKKKHIANVY